MFHRGPDEGGLLEEPGLALVSRRLSIVGLDDGHQPMTDEDGSVAVVFNGELFDYPTLRPELERRGHRFRTHADTELIPHLWLEHGDAMLERLRGQFAFALWDRRARKLVLARDRFGIVPLFWTRQRRGEGEWLLFASEIKALLASGMVGVAADVRGIDQLFTYQSLPGPLTCFEGIQMLAPGEYAIVEPDRGPPELSPKRYWEIEFPDRGAEDRGRDPEGVLDELEAALLGAVRRRLWADVPVVSFLSGGIDSSIVVAMACKLRGEPIPTFTVGFESPKRDESERAAAFARSLGIDPIVVRIRDAEILDGMTGIASSTEAPVVDETCVAIGLLAKAVHDRGYKVALTGEGSDDWLGGYTQFQTYRYVRWIEHPPIDLPLSALIAHWRGHVPAPSVAEMRDSHRPIGGRGPWDLLNDWLSMSRSVVFSAEMKSRLAGHNSYADLGADVVKLARWHPYNRDLYMSARVFLPGSLLSSRGDRMAMAHSVETRYPFLDEEVVALLMRLHPRWKMRPLQNKYVLRRLGERWLPREIARRPKAPFVVRIGGLLGRAAPPFVDQLLGEAAVRRAGYFDPGAVERLRALCRQAKPSTARTFAERALMQTLATQLWHQTFIDGSLADLPSFTRRSGDATMNVGAEPA